MACVAFLLESGSDPTCHASPTWMAVPPRLPLRPRLGLRSSLGSTGAFSGDRCEGVLFPDEGTSSALAHARRISFKSCQASSIALSSCHMETEPFEMEGRRAKLLFNKLSSGVHDRSIFC